MRVITATITVTTAPDGHPVRRAQTYRLITTMLDPDCLPGRRSSRCITRDGRSRPPTSNQVEHLGGRVLRARTPAGIDQEVYALLITYQVLRIAITDAI